MSKLPIARRARAPGRQAPEALASAQRQNGEGLGDYAARVLRESIRAGTFRAGEHLREAEFASWLGISRTPAREAFHRAITEGLLVAGPWNGAKVAELDAQQLVELYAVREIMEGAAAGFAALHISRAELEHLSRISDDEAASADDAEKLLQINADFHHTIYHASHNRYLVKSLQSVADSLGLVRHSTFALEGSVERARKEHVGIFEAIRDGNSKLAEERAREHVSNALILRLKMLRDRG